MNTAKRVLLVGWDAADWKVINPLIDEGKMPTLQRLIENGVMGNMATLSPAFSPMLWTSIATGKRPYKHGIYGFTEPTPDRKSVQPMTNASRKCKAIWNILTQEQKRSLVVGWWPSHPAEPINGVMVSDYYKSVPKKPGEAWPMMKGSVHPAELSDALEELRLHPSHLGPQDILPFVPNAATVDQETDHRLSGLMKCICECTTVQSAATHLLETESWDFAAVYFDAVDHFSHGFMRYHPPRQKHIDEDDFEMYKGVVSMAYRYHDAMLARLLQLAGDDVTVIVMSDHGFHPDHLRPAVLPSEPAAPAIEHRDLGIFVASGPGLRRDHLTHGANLLDITPTLLTMFGLPVGEDMDGKPLLDIFESPPEVQTIPSWEEKDGDAGRLSTDRTASPEESQEMLEQLIALGYIDRPDDRSEVAVAECQRELDFNLARAYMDGELYGEAIPLLVALYQKYPLEFRFGVQLANCLRAMNRTEDLEALIDNLNSRWRIARKVARKRLRKVVAEARKRREKWQELKAIDDQHKDDDPRPPKLARVNRNGRPQLFSEPEQHQIHRLRTISAGNPQLIDFFSATIATSKNDPEQALEHMEKAQESRSEDPPFQYHLGNTYLLLKRLRDAKAAFNRSLEFDPEYPQAMLGLCRAHLASGKNEQARDWGRKAIAVKFDYPAAHYFYGVARKRLGDTAGAIESINQALRQNPNFVEAHQELVDIYSGILDEERLAAEHRAMADDLLAGQAEVAKESERLAFEPADSADIEEFLPQFDTAGQSPRLPCLAQPKQAPAAAQETAEEQEPPTVIVVSGPPRSGTSMMMQMLVAGGAQPYTDEEREADESNPRGYYESEKVKALAQDNSWIQECDGKVIKVVTPLIPYLPQQAKYYVVSMQRDMEEVLPSQRKMLERLGRAGAVIDDESLGNLYERQHHFSQRLLQAHGVDCLLVPYADAVSDPAAAADKITEFLPITLDREAMIGAVDPKLHRQKSTV